MCVIRVLRYRVAVEARHKLIPERWIECLTKKISVKEHPSLIPWLSDVWANPEVHLEAATAEEAVVTVEGEEEAVTEEAVTEEVVAKPETAASEIAVVKPETTAAAVKLETTAAETAVVKSETASAVETIVVKSEITAPAKPVEAASAFETTAPPACTVRRCRRLH